MDNQYIIRSVLQDVAVNEPVPVRDTRKLSKFDVIQNILKNEFKTGRIDHLGKGIFQVSLAVITCTGANVTQYFTIPFLHRMHRIDVKHTDSAKADSVDALTYSLKYGTVIAPELLFALEVNTATIVTDTSHIYSKFVRSASRYQLISNTTNTDLLYVTLVIEIEDLPQRGE